ncbi:iron-sulfur cluster biosynthesis family protein [Ferdinandcohnia quinoae]|uniref:Iron-sulfur cluster biosynthesis family protein n=1 Tax=Fredinandcohnia quinoae TaxID=2918902 RepID=A0AAW5DW18_9BACI|nr:iron-sulfur cluster biosynthesis family protein [Fredinandcohnia sp. SECRCQ15]
MKIQFTGKAVKKLETTYTNKNKLLKLKYETDGCGCVLSGVTALWLIDPIDEDEDDIIIETNYQPILLEKSKMVFMDEEMTIDVVESANCFMLKSPNQILNPRLRLIEVGGTNGSKA